MMKSYPIVCCLLFLFGMAISPGIAMSAANHGDVLPVLDQLHSPVVSDTFELGNDSGGAQQDAKKTPTLSQLMTKYPDTFRTRGPRVKRIALTFDDVPDPRFTGKVLDVLQQYDVKATFFVVGNRAKKHPDLLKRIHEEGHAIGNHSYNHAQLNKLRLPDFIKQIERTNAVIESIVGVTPTLIRPPYGDINEEQLRWARKNGYKVVNWNVDSLDWKGLNKDEVKHNILSAIGPGSIVLQHAGGGAGSDLTGSIQALPEIITELKRQGYDFVTLPDMLGVPESK
ncbi:polysaccharide deacetylase family protein [Paenibacillus cisolokensis]